MGDLLTKLNSLFDLSKAVALTVPGVVTAFALALFIWPPTVQDIVMITTKAEADAVEAGKARCKFDPKDLEVAQTWSATALKNAAVKNQRILEDARQQIRRCMTVETGRAGAEEDQIKDYENRIKVAEKDRDAFQAQYQTYEKSGSSLVTEYRRKYANAEQMLNNLRAQIGDLQAKARERKVNVDLESVYLKIVEDRLADPGRLRPAKTLDDFLAGLTNHVIAFTVLALALGFLLDPINRSIFGGAFDWVIVQKFNRLHGSRFTVLR